MRRVDVRIDRLVLRGFDPADGKAFASALTAELSSALSDPSLDVTSRRAPVLRLRSASLERGGRGVRRCGAGIARAIARGLER